MRIVATLMTTGLLLATGGLSATARAADAPAGPGVPVSDLRLGVARTIAATPGPFDAVRSRLGRRVAGSMIDFYPVAGKGFHLSAGSRLHKRRNYAAEAEKATGGLLWAPRNPGAGARGSTRFAPVATVGYVQPIGAGVSLGVEGGARMGRAFGGMPRTPRLGAARGGGANPLVNVVLGYGF